MEGIYSTVILRDVLERNRVTDQSLLNRLVLFLADNIGSLTSPNSIGNVLSSEGDLLDKRSKNTDNVAGKTVDKYIYMLKSAFIFYGVNRYDIKGKQLLKTLGKYGETEVDFVAEKPEEKIYIQVTESMNNEIVRERELRSLMMIPDNYEKIVLTMDRNYIKSYQGIKVINMIDYLLGQ
ncbi:ATP-binding protein [Fusibacter sp. 3D3]|uniref:ATP-binding protein n=1 Tax=Fusibacter sp. 3D3 TaxID=1048380 RepID=UPI000853547F|nr:ATP-binding protein [Fusibacter sp. 3D3]GAU80044.1 ATPase [Fusibacter sp. 3D3]